MSFSKSLLVAAVLATVSNFALAKDKMVVGTEPTFAPFDFVDDKSNEIIGFDIDVMKAIGDAVDMDVQMQAMQFDGLIPAVLSHSIDAAISGLTKNPPREKQVLFSDPYHVAAQGMMVRTADLGKFKVMDDLKGKPICVQIGSVGANIAQGIENANVITYNTMPEAYMELKKGVCDAAITGTPVQQFYLVQTQDKDLAYVEESAVNAADLGIITNKSNTALMEKINAGLKTIKDNGTYQKIYDKWFKQ